MSNLTRRDFIKTATMAALAMAVPVKVFAADKADLVVYGKIFTSEGNKIVEAFAVKDGKFIYVGDKAGAQAFIDKGKTEIIDYTGKGLVMPACGNGHAHYLSAYAVQSIGTMIDYDDDVNKFLTEIVPSAAAWAGSSKHLSTICRPVSSWTPFAAIFPCTLPTKKIISRW